MKQDNTKVDNTSNNQIDSTPKLQKFWSGTGELIRDNARITKEGMIYYLDTLWKLPGAYMASKDQIKREGQSRNRINDLEGIQAIGKRIEESKFKMTSIGDWVSFAKEGTWNDGIKKIIERFDLSAGKLKGKAKQLDLDYHFFADSFLTLNKDTQSLLLIESDTDGNRQQKNKEIIERLKQIESIGDKTHDLVAQAHKLEMDVERFIDSKLSGLGKDTQRVVATKLRSGGGLGRHRAWSERLIAGTRDMVRRIKNTIKLLLMSLYYISRIVIFVIKYFVLVPAAFIKSITLLFKKKRVEDRRL